MPSHSLYSLDFEEFNVPLPASPPKSSLLKLPPQVTKPTPPSPSNPPTEMTPLVSSAATTSTEPPRVDNQTLVDGELEKRKARAARFGIPLVEPKKPHQLSPKKVAPSTKIISVPEDPEKLEARTARFGIDDAITQAPKHGAKRAAPVEEVDAEEHERRRKRAERFRSSNGAVIA